MPNQHQWPPSPDRHGYRCEKCLTVSRTPHQDWECPGPVEGKQISVPSKEVTCPFCGEAGFDLFGLKSHIHYGWCEPFDKIDLHAAEKAKAAAEKRCQATAAPPKCETCGDTGHTMAMVCYGGVPYEVMYPCPDCNRTAEKGSHRQ